MYQEPSNTLFSVSSDSSSVKSVEPIFALPPLPEDVPEDELVSGNYDVEFENGWRKSVSLSQLQRSGRVDKACVSDIKTDYSLSFWSIGLNCEFWPLLTVGNPGGFTTKRSYYLGTWRLLNLRKARGKCSSVHSSFETPKSLPLTSTLMGTLPKIPLKSYYDQLFMVLSQFRVSLC